MYNAKDISRMTGIKYITVYTRMNSKYAKQRWGVKTEILPDGKVRKYVPKDKIYLWLENRNFARRPTNKELQNYKKSKNEK